jgi:hypothetical protein
MTKSQAPFPSIAILTAQSVARNLDQALGLWADSLFSSPREKNSAGTGQDLGKRSADKPNQQPALGYGPVSRRQGIQMQQGLESLKEEFHLPAQSIQFQDRLHRKASPDSLW